MMKSFAAKPQDIQNNWIHIDADGLVLGRLATKIAIILRGKNKPYFSTHLNCGDHVVVTNAAKIVLTGKKKENEKYYRHTGHPGGIKETTAAKILEGKKPEDVLIKAVTRMLPKESPLARAQLKNLRVYPGAEHPHAAQAPKTLDFAALNPKNSKKESE